MSEQNVPQVYRAIAAVAAEIAQTGIAKDRKNTQQGYTFRGIDDVYNALAPILAKHGLCILPRVLSRAVTERQTKHGSALFYVTVGVAFDLVCAEDGSRHEIVTYGEAMDSADKATNKAMSAAYKYAAMQAFCIPTEGENDADAVTPDPVVPRSVTVARPRPAESTSAMVTVATAETIRNLCKATGTDVGKICAAYSVETLDDLDETQMGQVVTTLSKRTKVA